MKKNWKKDTEHLDLVSFSQPPESNKSTTIMASSPTVNHHQFSPTNHQQFSPTNHQQFSPTNQSSPTINLTHHVVTHHKHQPTPLTSPSNHSTPSELQSENEEPSPQNHNLSKCKRKINFPTFPPNKHQPATVARRNARERNRVKQVNNGFASLKQHIPPEHRAKKMSKVETLRCAVDYIRRLQVALNMSGRKSEGKGSVYGSMMDFESSYGGQSSEHLSLSPSSSDDPGEKRSFAHGSLSQGPDASSSATSPLGLCEYDNYDAVTSGDEDEFLDAFAIWQQS